MAVFGISTLVLALLGNAVFVFWKGEDDRGWEERWERLDDLERAWIAAASLSISTNRSTLVERGELDLAKGFSRRRRRRRARVTLAATPLLAVVAALILTGLLDRSAIPIAILILSGFLNFGNYFRERQIKNRYRATQHAETALTA